MTPCYRYLALVLLSISLMGTTATFAQSPGTVEGQFLTDLSGSTFTVTVQLRATPGTHGLGSSTIQFTYNNTALSYTSGSYAAAFDGVETSTDGGLAIYTNSTITQPSANKLSLNIDLVSTDTKGASLSSSFTDVAVLIFSVDNDGQLAELTWDTRAIFNGPGLAYTLGTFTDPITSLPVELVSFETVVDGQDVILSWQTASELNNAGFEIQRRSLMHQGHAGGLAPTQEPTWEVLGFVEGRGTTEQAQHYRFDARDLEAGRYVFRLKQVDYDGTFEYSPEVEALICVVGSYVLSPAYPNPFNPQTTFTLAVPQAQRVEVAVYDVLGRQVEVLYRDDLSANTTKAFVWRADNHASGLYFIRVVGERFVETQRVTLLK